MEPDPLDRHELAYLLGLAAKNRRKKENETVRLARRPRQTHEQFQEYRERHAVSCDWARDVEDHLIELLAEVAPEMLLAHQERRLRQLEEASSG